MSSVHGSTQTAFQLHKAENFQTLKEIYEGFYVTRQDSHAILRDCQTKWKENRDEYIKNHPDVFSRLNITIPPQEMKEIFNEYGIIALRRLENNKLTLCCGNSPIYCTNLGKNSLGDEYLSNQHVHHNEDTSDFNLLMNPSIVADMGSLPLINYIVSQKRQYQHIEAEIMNFCHLGDNCQYPSDLDNRKLLEINCIFLQKILQINGTYHHTYGSEQKNDPWLNTIRETANNYGLEMKVTSIGRKQGYGQVDRHLSHSLTLSKKRNIECQIPELKKRSIPQVTEVKWDIGFRDVLGIVMISLSIFALIYAFDSFKTISLLSPS